MLDSLLQENILILKNCAPVVMSKTKELAEKLGIVRRRRIESKSGESGKDDTDQRLKYLLVIDFESTCWKERAGAPPPEIIEFPVVLLSLTNGKIVSEFHEYVMPVEHPKLSSFCTELTGIRQQQVDDGLPITTCLVLFNQWLSGVREKEKFAMLSSSSAAAVNNLSSAVSLATCVTWSDWDLNLCLENECRRKHIRKPASLSTWIDIRAVYREFYKRKPQGLNGALRELGLSFEGREHSGIEDARNTARLVWRMVQDGWRPQDDKPQDGWRAHLDKPQLATNGTAKPSTSGISRPSTSNVLKPSNCGIAKPSGISRPSGSGISRPSSSGISKPTSSNISRPSNCGIAVPSNGETSKASSTATAKCPNTRVSNPSTVALSEKLSSATKQPPSEPNTAAICPVKIHSTVNTPSLVATKSDTILSRDSFKTPILKRTLGNASMPLMKGKTQPINATTPETNTLRQNIIPKYLNVPYKTPSRPSSSLLIPGNRPSPDGTPPFCHCGRRTRKHVAWRPGPNEGRTFFSCTLGSRQLKTGCKYFVWAQEANDSVRTSKS